jgi:hypothetical protein
MGPRSSRGQPQPAHRLEPPAGRADRPARVGRGVGIAIALFAEPCRGTHSEKAPVMLLGVAVNPTEEPLLFGVDSDGHPLWFTFPEVTFDWRWSPELDRWADLDELVNPPVR